jgi:hypothetical protein
MIKGFEQPHPTEPIAESHWQATPAVAAGLIAGVVLLILPHASPWEGLTSFTPALMGRVVPPMWGLGIFLTAVLHLVLAIIYGVLVSLAVSHIRQMAAIVAGGVAGLVLYFINLGVVTACFPAMRGNEVSVFVTHVVFGLIAAGAYRGLLRRRVSIESNQNPTSPPVPPAA